ncbi:MAG TPA: PKD domain-containing protein [Thermoplasmatales archaeon]|nr:PKD domain-containing protein [Thermoplasmatales archaeon]
MSLKVSNVDKKMMTYMLSTILIIAAGMYVVFFMPTSENTGGATNGAHLIAQGEAPVAVISTSGGYQGDEEIDLIVFSGTTVEFDGSGSYDPDGEIVAYEWSFDDGTILEGVKVSYTFKIDNPVTSFNVSKLPVFSPLLTVYDEDGRQGFARVFVKVFPTEYTFYLDEDVLSLSVPAESSETVKLPFFGKNRKAELSYELDEPLYLPTCSCNITLHLQKPRLSLINKIVVSVYDADGNETILAENTLFQLLGFWKNRVLTLDGTIQDAGVGIKGVKVSLYGFSVRGVSILYGGDEPSMFQISLV